MRAKNVCKYIEIKLKVSNRVANVFVLDGEIRYGKWFKTRLFGKIHIYIPSPEGAKTVLTNDFIKFNKGYVKSMGDAVGKKSLLTVPHESHRRIRRLLSNPFSTSSLSKFVQKLDMILLERLKSVEEKGGSFVVLDFCMKVDLLTLILDIYPFHFFSSVLQFFRNRMMSTSLKVGNLWPGAFRI